MVVPDIQGIMTNEWSFVFIGLKATVKLLVIVIILMLEKFNIFFSQRIQSSGIYTAHVETEGKLT